MIKSVQLFLFLFILTTLSSTAFAKGRIITCDEYSGKTLERKAKRFNNTINHASKKYGVSSDFIKAVITVETCFRPNARGTSGERGLMQLMPATARQLGVKNAANSWQNIHGGARYLKFLLKRFNGNKSYAAAAYNGGPGAVSRKTGPRFKQVRRYSGDVMRAYHKIRVTPSHGSKPKRKKSLPKSRKVKKARKNSTKKRKKYKKGKKNLVKNKRIVKRTKKTKYRGKAYKVRRNQSLSLIAKKTGVSVKRLKKLNHLKSSRIRVGQRLKLK